MPTATQYYGNITESSLRINHYKWLEKHFPDFIEKLLGGEESLNCKGLIGAHGDKCYSYKPNFKEAGIDFPHGVAIYLLTYMSPFSKEVRETEHGWVDAGQWVIDNKARFLPLLNPIDDTDEDVIDWY